MIINSRRNTLVSLLVLALVVAAIGAGAAPAAAPTKGASYVGELAATQNRVSKRVVMKVARNGRSATARISCNGTRFGTLPRFKIKRGKFSGVRKAGTLIVWRLRGSFTSRTKARAKLWLPATCDGKGGTITLVKTP